MYPASTSQRPVWSDMISPDALPCAHRGSGSPHRPWIQPHTAF